MGVIGLVVLVAVGVVGWFAYRELKLMETDILHDIEMKNSAASTVAETSPALPPDPVVLAAADPVSEPKSLDDRIQVLIADQPGIMQTEIYARMPGYNRKQLQQTLLVMDRAGSIRREKEKGSYRIYLKLS
jgi:hypothetical protein